MARDSASCNDMRGCVTVLPGDTSPRGHLEQLNGGHILMPWCRAGSRREAGSDWRKHLHHFLQEVLLTLCRVEFRGLDTQSSALRADSAGGRDPGAAQGCVFALPSPSARQQSAVLPVSGSKPSHKELFQTLLAALRRVPGVGSTFL